MSIFEIRQLHSSGQIVADDVQAECLRMLLAHPTANVVDDVSFLIERTVCPVDGPHDFALLVVDQPCFPGQLEIVRLLVAAGAPVNAAKIAAHKKFEHLWDLIVGSVSYSLQ